MLHVVRNLPKRYLCSSQGPPSVSIIHIYSKHLSSSSREKSNSQLRQSSSIAALAAELDPVARFIMLFPACSHGLKVLLGYVPYFCCRIVPKAMFSILFVLNFFPLRNGPCIGTGQFKASAPFPLVIETPIPSSCTLGMRPSSKCPD